MVMEKLALDTAQMEVTSPTSSGGSSAIKRPLARTPSPNPTARTGGGGGGVPATGRATAAASSFRNVSACNRCRLRKNRCDQNLPACVSCEKAGAKCVGYDPITKREIPRSYVNYLETRNQYLEDLLAKNQIPFEPATTFDLPQPSAHHHVQSPIPRSPASETHSDVAPMKAEDDQAMNDISMLPVQGTSDPRYLGSVSGISFARVVVAAVKSTNGTNMNGSQRGRLSSIGSSDESNGGNMRDSFFGLTSNRRKYSPAAFPSRRLGMRLIRLYFEHANPQVPTLHRGEFEALAERVWASENLYTDGAYEPGRGAKEMYLMNIVFAIGAGIFLSKDAATAEEALDVQMGNVPNSDRSKSPNRKRRKLSQDGVDERDKQFQPEEYHTASLQHLEAFLSSDSKGGLEELQAVLLLAGYALLRPVAPGLWYIVGVAMRLAVDLGLHYEDGNGDQGDAQFAGRRAWNRDMRRRLWWCTYSLDRLVSTCVGRPFGISDECVSTKFPSLLDDKYITPDGFIEPPPGAPSYKHISYHYFRLRLIQSEILQVLQYQAHNLSNNPPSSPYPSDHPNRLQPPFLAGHTISSWHKDISRRIKNWFDTAPRSKNITGVSFPSEFLDLNYWQMLIMLYRPSLKVPSLLASTVPAGSQQATIDRFTKGVGIGTLFTQAYSRAELEAEETTCMIVAEAGSKILRLYRQLHRVDMANYTYLATHHIFMAGVSFLYAIWHSAGVRQRLTMDEIEFTTWAGTSVLDGLTPKCPPAATCKKVFERMAQLTIKTYLQSAEIQYAQQTAPIKRENSGTPQMQNVQPPAPPRVAGPFGSNNPSPAAQTMPPPALYDKTLHNLLFAPAPSGQTFPSPPSNTPPQDPTLTFSWNENGDDAALMPLLDSMDGGDDGSWDEFMMNNASGAMGVGAEVMGGFGDGGTDTFGGFFFGN